MALWSECVEGGKGENLCICMCCLKKLRGRLKFKVFIVGWNSTTPEIELFPANPRIFACLLATIPTKSHSKHVLKSSSEVP